MPPRLLTVPEAARYLRLNPRSVYLLAQRGVIPATRVTGKWLFPEHLLAEWLEASARGSGRTRLAGATTQSVAGRMFVAGSDDPALDVLAELLARQPRAPLLFLARVGSVAGLHALAAHRADAACVHLVDADSGEYNGAGLNVYFERRAAAIVNLFHRDLGLVVPPGNPRRLTGLVDLGQPGLRFVNRQPGSGTRHFVDLTLGRAGVETRNIAGYDHEVSTHWAVGLPVLRGAADVGVAVRSVAQALGLDFVPVARERFDMVIPKETFFRPEVQTLVETARSEAFRAGLERLGGYDVEQSGRVLAEVS